MDSNNWRAAQGQVRIPGRIRVYGDCDWKTQLHSDSRLRIVNKIMETLKRHIPFSGQEGLQELHKTAIKFEEKIYNAAKSQDDYLRTISLKMLTMEAKSQNPIANSLQPDAASNSRNPQDLAQGQVMSGDAVANPDMEGGDWRTQLQPDSRQRIVNKIMETLKRHLPFSGQEGLQELKRIAMKFEEKVYAAATSQDDYLRTISLKMLTMEAKSQNPIANSLQPDAASNSRNPQDLAQGQAQIPGQVMSGDAVANPDWRTQLRSDFRQRIVNNIMETLKRHIPFCGQLQELKRVAIRFEEKMYTVATSQDDYLRKISSKMLTMEAKSQNPIVNSLQPDAASNSRNPQDPENGRT